MDTEPLSGQIRGTPLMEGEVVATMLHSSLGPVDEPPLKGSLLALTDRRAMAFVDLPDRKEVHITLVDKIDGFSFTANARPLLPLLQGLFLVFAGAMVYLTLGYFTTGIPFEAGLPIAATLGAAIALMGVLFVARYAQAGRGGVLILRAGPIDLTFPYASRQLEPYLNEAMHRFLVLEWELLRANDGAKKSPAAAEPPDPPPKPPPRRRMGMTAAASYWTRHRGYYPHSREGKAEPSPYFRGKYL